MSNISNTKLDKALAKFIKTNDDLAKKYGMKVSVSVSGPGFETEEVVIADHLSEQLLAKEKK